MRRIVDARSGARFAVAVALCALPLLAGCAAPSLDNAKVAAQDAFASIASAENERGAQTGMLITAQNNSLFASFLQAESPSGATVMDFVEQYRGRTVEFDATISSVSDDQDAPGERTFNDIQLVAGDSAERTSGPVFVLRDVNVSSTGLSDIAPGQQVDLVATIDSFDAESGQVVLSLVSIGTRA